MMVPSPPCSHPETCTSSALPSRASASPTLGVTHFRYRRGPAESKADLGEMRGTKALFLDSPCRGGWRPVLLAGVDRYKARGTLVSGGTVHGAWGGLRGTGSGGS